MNVIEVSHLSFSYARSKVLEDLSFEVGDGSFLAIAGPNGVGKSTLLGLLCGLLRMQRGSVKIAGRAIQSYGIEALAHEVAAVRQEFVPVFGYTVGETVLMARTPYYGRMGFESKADREIVTEALEATDTAAFVRRPLAQLSGGERQRVFIARALAQETGVLLLDEPTSLLDLKHQVGIYDLLKMMQLEKGKTIVVVTHDINLATQYADFALLLAGDGGYEAGRAREVLCAEQIEKVFGVRIFAGSVGQEKFFIPLGKFSKDGCKMVAEPPPGQGE